MSHDDRPPSHLYWMRAVSFAGLHRLLTAVAAVPAGLRAGEINALVLDRHVRLTTRTPQPKPTTLYHYRNTLVQLGALVRDGLRLRANRNHPDVAALLAEPTPANENHVVNHAAREHFATLVLKNEECRALFVNLFSPARGPVHTVSDFRRHGTPVTWMRRPPPDASAIVFRNRATGRETTHASRAAIPARIRLPGAGLIFSSGNGRKWTEPSGKLLHDEVVPAQICRHRSVGLCGCEEAGNEGHEGRLAGRRTCAEHVAVESAHGRLAVPLSPRQLVGASSAATVGPAGSLAGRWVWRLPRRTPVPRGGARPRGSRRRRRRHEDTRRGPTPRTAASCLVAFPPLAAKPTGRGLGRRRDGAD